MLTLDKLDALLRPYLETELKGSDVERIEIKEEGDHDNTPSIYVRIYFKKDANTSFNDNRTKIRDGLFDLVNDAGDRRFVYLHSYDYFEPKKKRAATDTNSLLWPIERLLERAHV